MSKVKRIALPIVFVFISVFLIYLAFAELNIFPSLNFAEILGVNLSIDENCVPNAEIIKELEEVYGKEIEKNSLPGNMNALWIDINRDITADAEAGTNAVKYSIYSDMDYYRNFIPDTVFIKPDTEGEYSSLKEDDGTDYDILAYLLYYVRSIGCEAVLVADDSILLDSSMKPHTKELENYLKKYDFTGVLISVDAAYSESLYTECAKTVSSFIKDKYSHLVLGIEIHSDSEKAFADEYVIQVFQDKLVDFGYVDCLTTSGDEAFPFQSVALWWNYFAEFYNVPLYCENRLDRIFAAEGDWSFSNEINKQLKALYNCSFFKGNCFYNASSLIRKTSLARELAIFLNDVAETNSDAYSINTLTISGNDIQFTGNAYDSVNVYCNDKRVVVEEGAFVHNDFLVPGMNDFIFFGNGAEYVHSVYDNSSLFYKCSSSEEAVLESDMTVQCYAVCPEGADVFAVVNGSYVKMEPSEAADIPHGYSYYSCSVSFFAKKINSAELDIVCFYKEKNEVRSCGNVLKKTSRENDDEVYYGPASPYSDNGLGTSLMCVTKYDNTEIIAKDYDVYHAYNSSLPEGVIDYVEKISVSDGGYLIYELKSGLNIYGVNAILINNGYNMPANNIILKGKVSSADKTDLIFSEDWMSPVTVTVKDVEYVPGYENYSFNVKQFDADYIDINFYYSQQFNLSESFTLTDDPMFSSYEVFTDSQKSVMILRLYLRDKGSFYGYDICTDENDNVVISFKNLKSTALTDKVVMIDPGHGGLSMVGTALNDNSVSESKITLGIALYAKKYLEEMGIKVIMTRTMDTSLSLSERTYMSETMNPDVFVSIHCDGADNLEESGTHTFYYTPFSYGLADAIHNRIVKAYTEKIYVPSDANFARTDRGVKFYPFYVTRIDNCPSVLVETGFLTNYVEGNVLANPVNQEYIGYAIASGIVDYLS